ncbi:hypothetical protein [Mucilaginibacter aquaedulcis]|uniref:hypothetical protein n=1 Tax=Mucilaginibacter aquaedulcis TaxID=1187081 RepID=UPI0025B5FAE6|nr:hypothetical protein [Mucilaginibacter aquaedulcis]MDN3548904.1 hypothetical protein [Mucilaginibacter aquaedulcis]
MKKILISAAAIMLLLVIACSKYNTFKDSSPTGVPAYLFGKLQLTDTLSQNVIDKPLASKTVYICFSENYDGLNFLYSTTTDADGYFKFTQLNSAKTYIVFYKEVTTTATFIAQSAALQLPQEKYVLQASLQQTDQTGLLATIQDEKGNPLKGAALCFGASPVAMRTGVCDGSNYSGISSDELGHASVFNVTPNTYYALAKLTINNVVYSDTAKIVITARNLLSKTFKLKPPAMSSPSTSLSVQLTDANGSSIAGGSFCLFTSKIAFARDTCEASNYSIQTDVTGKGSIMNIPEGKYYVLAQLAFKNGKLLARDSVLLGGAPVNLIMRLK